MAQASRTAFPHRHNADGTVDSICSECFRIVASSSTEAQLEVAERVHHYRCDGFSLITLYSRTEDERHPGRCIWPQSR